MLGQISAPREAFVPGVVLEEARAGTGPTCPAARHLLGVVLLADIAGSVKEAQRLLQEEERGGGPSVRAAEQLSLKLNASIRQILAVARAWRADLLRFLGDAVLLLLPAPDAAALPAAARRALGLARDLLAPPPAGAFQLHVAVAAGPLAALTLGGVGGKVDLSVQGEPLARIATALGHAPPGALCLAPELLEAAACRPDPAGARPGGYAVFDGRSAALAAACAPAPEQPEEPLPPLPSLVPDAPSGNPLLADRRGSSAAAAAAAAALSPYLPADIEWVLANGGRFLTELRVATCAFVLMAPPAPDAFQGEGLAGLSRRVSVVQAAAGRTEGAVRSFFRDDKGFVALLSYGLAGLAHADDPLRACSAAVRVREAFAAEGLGPVSIGIATGRVFCGLVGDERRCDYTVLGDSVNMAARLMAAAGGAVWVDRATHDAVAAAFVSERLPPLALKGRERPMEAFALLRREFVRGAASRSFLALAHPAARGSRRGSSRKSSQTTSQGGPPDAASEAGGPSGPEGEEAASEGEGLMFGRAEVRGRLAAFLQEAALPAGAGVLLVEGEAGSGKTVLVSEALRMAEARGLPCILLAGDPLEATRPYHALRLALRSLVGDEGPAPLLLPESEEPTPLTPVRTASGTAWVLPTDGEADPPAPPPPAGPALPEPLSPGAAAGLRRAALFARRASLPKLREALQAGPPPGKADEARAAEGAGGGGWRVVPVGGDEPTTSPRSPRSPLGDAPLPPAAERCAAFLRSVDPGLCSPYNARLLAALLESEEDGAEGGPPAAQSPAGRAEGRREAGDDDRLSDATLLFLTALLRRVLAALGALLVVEDASALDSATLKLLAALAAAPGPSILLTARPPAESEASRRSSVALAGPAPVRAPPAALGELRRGPRARVCALGPLNAEETRRFVAHLLDVEAEGVPEWLAGELADRARGNAFVVQEMVALLRSHRVVAPGPDRRLVVLDASGAPLGAGQRREALPVPPSLERLVISRLDRLPPDAALVAKLASVLGTRFEHGTALSVLAAEMDPAAVARSLATLEVHGVLLREAAGRPVPEFRFAHAAVADVLYQLLTAADRRRLHWRAALDLEARPSSLGRGPSSLAHHCERAGALQAAVAYLDAAMGEAMAAGAYAEALELAQRAVALAAAAPGDDAVPTPGMSPLKGSPHGRAALASPAAAARRWQLAARALFSLGAVSEAEGALERALRLLRLPLCREAPVLTGLAAALARALLRGPAGRPGAGREGAEAGEGRRVASGCLTLYSHILAHRGETLAAVYYALRNVLLAGEEPESAAYIDACAFMYSSCTLFGMRKKAAAFLERARGLLRLPRLAPSLGYLAVHEVSVKVVLGALPEAEALAVRAALELERAGDLRAAGELVLNAGYVAAVRGRFALADAAFLHLARDARSTSNRLRLHWALTGWAGACCMRGWPAPGGETPAAPPPPHSLADVADAIAEAGRAFEDGDCVVDRLREAAVLAHVRLLQGDPAAAAAEALAALAWLRGHRRRPLVGTVYVYQLVLPSLFQLADTLAALAPARPELRAALRDVVAVLARGAGGYALVRPQAAIARGRWHALRGAPRPAAAAFREAAGAAAAIGARYFEARALGHLAACPAAAPAERLEAARAAAALYADMGAHPPPPGT